MASLNHFLISFFSLALLISGVSSRALSPVPLKNSILVSDGVHGDSEHEFLLTLEPQNSLSGSACAHVYGFLPCADNVGGYVFQVLTFGGLLIIGDYLLSQGRSKLFLIFEVGFYGGIIFPLLMMVPRIALMLSSGLALSSNVAKTFIGDNVAVTVGYTVFALTIQWGACILFSITGGSNSDQSVGRSTTDGRSKQQMMKSMFEARVEVNPKNKKDAGIMLLSLAPFLMMTLSEICDTYSWSRIIVLFTLIISSSATIVYFFYSFFNRDNQKQSLDQARFEIMSEVHKHLQKFSPENLIHHGEPSKESLKRLFKKADTNNDERIEISELKDLTLELWNFGTMKCDVDELAKDILEKFDGDSDGLLEEKEFEDGITKLLKEYKFHSKKMVEDQKENHTEDEVIHMVPERKVLSTETLEAFIQVVAGILVVFFLARPFMMNIELLSNSVGVPSFYVVFAIIPLFRNLKNVLSARFCRKKDKRRISSNTFSEIYKDVTMNNLMGMSIILAIVYTKGLPWNFTIEVLILVIIGLAIGLPAYLRTTYPFWVCILAFSVYLLSLLLIYFRFHFLEKN